MQHNFNTNIAEIYGIHEAVLLQNLYYWIKKNIANEKNLFDDYYWTYNSVSAYIELFPYMSEHKIRYSLKNLEENGLIITGNYNKSKYDRTKWYALTAKAFELFNDSICQNHKHHLTKSTNGIAKNHEPIPNNKPYNKPNKKPNNTVKQSLPIISFELSEKILKNSGLKYDKKRIESGAKVINDINIIDKYSYKQIELAINYGLKDDFWHNKMAPAGLRKKRNGPGDFTKFEKILKQAQKKEKPIDEEAEKYRIARLKHFDELGRQMYGDRYKPILEDNNATSGNN